MIEVLKKLNQWFDTFTGALAMAVFCFINVIGDISVGSHGWAWTMGVCTLYWLYKVRKATTKKLEVELTPDQTAKIEEATKTFRSTLAEVEREMIQAARKRAEKEKTEKEKTESEQKGETDA